MEKQEFQKYLQDGILLLDGATGSNLQKLGMPSGVCVEQWVCEHKDVLMQLQKEYIEAGSRVIYASTFAANRIKFKEFGLEEQVEAINKQVVAISKQVAEGKAIVAGDVTMTGQQLEPLGPVKFEELIAAYKEQMIALEQGGADLIAVETMLSLQETRAAFIAAKESVKLPVMATMSFGEDGRTLYGTDAKTAAIVLESLGAVAVGMNCSAGPDKMRSSISNMKAVVKIPIIAKPNAGMPKLGQNGITEYDMAVDEYVGYMMELVEAGASILGGCCGTDPDYIRALKARISDCKATSKGPETKEKPIYITSERNAIEWKETCTIGILGNSDRTELNEDWEEELYDSLYDLIDDLDEQDILCICVDGCQGQREEIMRSVIREAVSYTSKPIVFRSFYKEVLEAALRVYPGRSGIILFEGQEKDSFLGLAKKYGAVIKEDFRS